MLFRRHATPEDAARAAEAAREDAEVQSWPDQGGGFESEAGRGLDGPSYRPWLPPRLLIKITGAFSGTSTVAGQKYNWEEVYRDAAAGTWPAMDGGRTSALQGIPALEGNANASVATGTVAEAQLHESGLYYLFFVNSAAGTTVSHVKVTSLSVDGNGDYPAVVSTPDSTPTPFWADGVTQVKYRLALKVDGSTPAAAPVVGRRYLARLAGQNGSGEDVYVGDNHLLSSRANEGAASILYGTSSGDGWAAQGQYLGAGRKIVDALGLEWHDPADAGADDPQSGTPTANRSISLRCSSSFVKDHGGSSRSLVLDVQTLGAYRYRDNSNLPAGLLCGFVELGTAWGGSGSHTRGIVYSSVDGQGSYIHFEFASDGSDLDLGTGWNGGGDAWVWVTGSGTSFPATYNSGAFLVSAGHVQATGIFKAGDGTGTISDGLTGTIKMNALAKGGIVTNLGGVGSVPATATSTGTAGEMRADSNWLYVCTATNTWRRVAIAAW